MVDGGLLQAAVPAGGEAARRGGGQPPAARTRPCAACPRSRAAGRRGPQPTYGKKQMPLAKRAGQTPRLGAGRVRAVREAGDQDGQDVPGDLAAGGRSDPGGAGARGGRLAGVLLHEAGGDGGGSAGGGGGPGGRGADVQGRQGGVGGGRAAGAEPGCQRGLLQPERVDVQRGGGVGVGAVRSGVGGPQRAARGTTRTGGRRTRTSARRCSGRCCVRKSRRCWPAPRSRKSATWPNACSNWPLERRISRKVQPPIHGGQKKEGAAPTGAWAPSASADAPVAEGRAEGPRARSGGSGRRPASPGCRRAGARPGGSRCPCSFWPPCRRAVKMVARSMMGRR